MFNFFRRPILSRRNTAAGENAAQSKHTSIRIVHIIAASYSGSTWLNLMLGSHPDSFSIGEMFWIKELGRPYCAFHGDACDVWSRIDVQKAPEMFHRLAAATGKKTMIVNNSLGIVDAASSAGIPTRHLHLIRDGRAVTASYRRKHPEKSVHDACVWWKSGVDYHRKQLGKHPPEHVLAVRYEDLQQDPLRGLNIICDSLGQQYSEEMLQYDTRTEHFVGGNLGTLSMVARSQGRPAPTEPPDIPPGLETPDWGLEFYENQDAGNFVDNRWDAERVESEDVTFNRLAGRLNKKLGYE